MERDLRIMRVRAVVIIAMKVGIVATVVIAAAELLV
jgi:hypothetical protein